MFTASGSGQLGALLTLMEYMSDPKNRKKEIKELLEAAMNIEAARKALAKAHGGAKKLDEADRTLAEAQTKASVTLSNLEKKSAQMIVDAEKQVGDLLGEQKRLEVLRVKLKSDRASFEEAILGSKTELEHREQRVTKRENDIGRARDDLGKDQLALRSKVAGVAQAMKG